MKQLAASIIVMIIITSCSNKITAPLTSTLNTEAMHHKWKVMEMAGFNQALPDVYLDLRDIYKTHASAGCDSVIFTPKYNHNNRVDFMHVMVPLQTCKGSTLADQQLIKNLNQVYSYSVAANQLSLFDQSHKKLFEAVYHPDDEHGSVLRRWEIITMINANNDALLKHKAFIDLTNINQGNAYLGCNNFNFPITLKGKYNMTIADAAATKKYCAGDVNDEVFLKVLPLVNMYQVVGNKLQLFDKNGTLLLEAISPLH